jgi:hypothetical protein
VCDHLLTRMGQCHPNSSWHATWFWISVLIPQPACQL